MRNLHQLVVLCTASQIIGRDFAKFCGLLRIYELYFADYTGRKNQVRPREKIITGENGKLTFSNYPAFFITYSFKTPPN